MMVYIEVTRLHLKTHDKADYQRAIAQLLDLSYITPAIVSAPSMRDLLLCGLVTGLWLCKGKGQWSLIYRTGIVSILPNLLHWQVLDVTKTDRLIERHHTL